MTLVKVLDTALTSDRHIGLSLNYTKVGNVASKRSKIISPKIVSGGDRTQDLL